MIANLIVEVIILYKYIVYLDCKPNSRSDYPLQIHAVLRLLAVAVIENGKNIIFGKPSSIIGDILHLASFIINW